MKTLCFLIFLMTSPFVDACPDSTLVLYHADGQQAATIEHCGEKLHGKYTRWYPNGRLHWEIQFQAGQKNGEARFFNLRGKCVLQVHYVGDSLMKVQKQSKRVKVIFGALSYSSVVHGGMMRDDGTSNIQRSQGVLKNHTMYFANWNPDKRPTKEFRFNTDQFGWYAVIVPVGDYGLFEAERVLADIEPGEFAPPHKSNKGWQQGWNINEPIRVKPSDSLLEKDWNRSFTGFAP